MERIEQTLRIPRDLQQQLKDCARENGRSLNAEIVQRLKASLGYQR